DRLRSPACRGAAAVSSDATASVSNGCGLLSVAALVVRLLAGGRVEEELVTGPVVVEVEHVVERAGDGIERLIAGPAERPVVLDEAEDRRLICDRMVDEVRLRKRGDHEQWLARPVAAAIEIRPGRRRPAQAGPTQGIVGAGGMHHDRPDLMVVPAVGVVVGD